MLEETAKHIFETHCSPQKQREMVETGSFDALWQEWQASGFADAMRPTDHGGSGLHPIDVFPVLLQAGYHAAPLPLGESMMVQAATKEPLAGPASIAPFPGEFVSDGIRISSVPFGSVCGYVACKTDQGWSLFSTDQATRSSSHGMAEHTADLLLPPGTNDLGLQGNTWFETGALMRAVAMAGAISRLADMTVSYAQDREQFGQPIAKRQAIQQQVSYLVEAAYAARMAAQMGLSGFPSVTTTAIAKSRINEAATRVGPIAHAVHGAIGITKEYDLQLYSRLLVDGRQSFGSETYWNRRLGSDMLASGLTSLEFVQQTSTQKRLASDI